MHIPLCQTQELEILTFAQALVPTRNDYDRDRWLYIPDHYAEYRYLLGTRGVNPLICIGINPSTAAPGDLDNTLKSVERIALGNGFDSFLMFNVYAQRATRPEDMDRVCNQTLHRENMAAFRYVLEQVGEGFRPAVWAAWGTIIEKREYLWDCLQDMIAIGQARGARWAKCGKTSAAGHPHHPLYLRSDSPIEVFPVEEYVQRRPAAKKKRKSGGGL